MGKKILVIDNHPMMLTFMTRLLEREGHQILSADNGLVALDILKTETPDAIFTDLIMPHIDGEKLCRMIRKMPRLKDVCLIVFSAIAAEQEVDFKAFGADFCIAKGPLNKMAEHVLSALDLLDHRTETPLSGKIIGGEDVYPRHITEELLSIKRHFEIILEGMSEGILEINSKNRIVYANPSANTIISLPEERLLGMPLIDLFEDPDRQRVKNLLVPGSLSQVIPEEHPVWVNRKQISMRVFPVTQRDSNERIVILRDLTEQKKMEAQLFQAQKMEAIGTLAGGVAHDFNNLLMVVQGNVSLILLDIDPSHPHYEMLRTIEKKVQSGSRLTKQLLGYASHGKYEPKPVCLNQLVKETSDSFGRTRKSITLHHDLAQDVYPIEADEGQIEQVLMNLLINAADAMPLGGELFLKTANISHKEIQGKLYQPKPGDYVVLTVTDTGVGIDPNVLGRIFDPFFTTKQFGKGTGLGLALVYGIVKGHGGYIDAESENGKGTTFRIYLPAIDTRIEIPAEEPDPIQRGTETILIVDDEDLILEVGQKILTVMGYRVLMARDGEEAVEVYRNHREQIDLVILDLVMPKMEGGEVFQRLKQISPDLKVLVSSGYSIDGKVSQILERGACGFIQKPFDMHKLSHSLRTILNA